MSLYLCLITNPYPYNAIANTSLVADTLSFCQGQLVIDYNLKVLAYGQEISLVVKNDTSQTKAMFQVSSISHVKSNGESMINDRLPLLQSLRHDKMQSSHVH